MVFQPLISALLRRATRLAAGVLLLLMILASIPSPANQKSMSAQPVTSSLAAHGHTERALFAKSPAERSYRSLPLRFEFNRGQVAEDVSFVSRGIGGSLFLTPREAVLVSEYTAPAEAVGPVFAPVSQRAEGAQPSILRMQYVGANPKAKAVGMEKLPGKVNYFIGIDSQQWRVGIPTYDQVRYEALYPGIDLVYSMAAQQLRYDFVLAPEANPSHIRLAFQGPDRIEVDADGNLVLHTALGQVRHSKPLIFQEKEGTREIVNGGYLLLDEHEVGFQIAAYDTKRPLVIDPTLDYATYLGGRNADEILALAVDDLDYTYVTGSTASYNFPVEGGVQPTKSGGRDTFVAKLSPDGATLIYACYLGGSRFDRGTGIAVDSEGHAFLTGTTYSWNFPTANALQPTYARLGDAFIAKLDPTGSAIIYSTYLGGKKKEKGNGIALDEMGAAYVVGTTSSRDFPTANALQPAYARLGDAFITKLDPDGTALLYSTYLGGNKKDEGYGIALDEAGAAFVVGSTSSRDFPTANALQPSYARLGDAFIAKLDPDGSVLTYSTYLGGKWKDKGNGIALDETGSAYVVGSTSSRDFPTANALQPTHGGGWNDAFVAKLNPNGTVLDYSTYLGGHREDQGLAIAVNWAGSAFLTGRTNSSTLPMINAVQSNYGGGLYDAFVAAFLPDGSALAYSSYLGGSKDDRGFGIGIDMSGNTYVAGTTRSRDFPTINALQGMFGGGWSDAFLARISIEAPTIAFVNPTDGAQLNEGTLTFDITFEKGELDLDLNSFQLLVNGVDVSADAQVTPAGATYTPSAPLPTGQNTATASIADKVGISQSTTISFEVLTAGLQAIADCSPTSGPIPLAVRFRSRGEFPGGSIVRYRWDFEGDGVFDTSDAVARDYTHTYQQKGTYDALLEVTSNLGNTATDTCTLDARGNPPTATANVSPSNGAIPLTVDFTCVGNDAEGNITLYEWDFDGDGTFDYSSPSSGTTSHTYTTQGTFVAVCRVTDDDGMTGEARTTTTVIRPGPLGSPSVEGTATPASGNASLTVNFNGTVTDGGSIVLWEWDFEGDGVFDFSSPTSPATSHTYANGGVFAPALRVTDNDGLTSTDTVEVIVNLTASLTIPDDTFDPAAGETTAIHADISAGVRVRLRVKDAGRAVVRTLVDEFRVAGSYDDVWDGTNDAGEPLTQGEYYAVLEYDFDSETRVVDLTDTTGGTRYNPSRNRLPITFSPYEDDFLTINFTIPANWGVSEVEVFIGLFNTDTRFINLLNRDPFGVGTHTIYWDGLDANGNFAVPPPGDRFLFGIFGYTLPDNAIMLQTAPVISNVSVDPNFFDPSTPDFLTPANPIATVTYDLDKLANVELTVTNLNTGRVLRSIQELNVTAGTGNTIEWNGRADNGLFVDAGDYRLALQATDSNGSGSIVRYALVRVFY